VKTLRALTRPRRAPCYQRNVSFHQLRTLRRVSSYVREVPCITLKGDDGDNAADDKEDGSP
jgi:hypothetical protein